MTDSGRIFNAIKPLRANVKVCRTQHPAEVNFVVDLRHLVGRARLADGGFPGFLAARA
jgi:hypothetical protein